MAVAKTPDSLMSDILKVVLALFLPPLAVLIETGFSKQLLINIVLCILGFIPGMIHAVYVIAKY